MALCVQFSGMIQNQAPCSIDPSSQLITLTTSIQEGVFASPSNPDRRYIFGDGLELIPKAETEVLLVFSAPNIRDQSAGLTDYEVRHDIGHALLYLRNPKARNNCRDAHREWRRSVNLPDDPLELAEKRNRRERNKIIKDLETLGC